jgi:hypothetical protein
MKKANFSTRWFNYVADHLLLTKVSEKAVLFAMKTYMDNKTGECFPSEVHLAKRASCTPRTVRTVIKKARDLGLLVIQKRKPKSGCGYPHNHYRAQIPEEIFDLNPDKTMEKYQKVQEIKALMQENKTKPEEKNVSNQRKQFPPNYTNKYTKDYLNNCKPSDTLNINNRIEGFSNLPLNEIFESFIYSDADKEV